MKEILKVIPISTLVLVYLFVCGVLYLIGFWSTFSVNVFSLISIYDIPKNFVFPLLISQGFFVITFITGGIANLNDDREDIRHFVTINPNWSLKKTLIIGVLSLIDLWLIIFTSVLYFVFKRDQTIAIFWSLSSITVAYYLLHQFVNIKELKEIIKSKTVRAYVGHVLIFLPISCFSIGKVTSLQIYNNEENKYVRLITTIPSLESEANTQYKFLGYVSEQVIISSFDNKHIFIYNKTDVNGIELISK